MDQRLTFWEFDPEGRDPAARRVLLCFIARVFSAMHVTMCYTKQNAANRALVDLLHRVHTRIGDLQISLGIASIGAALKTASIPHRIFSKNVAQAPSSGDIEQLADAVATWKPNVAGIGAYVWNRELTSTL